MTVSRKIKQIFLCFWFFSSNTLSSLRMLLPFPFVPSYLPEQKHQKKILIMILLRRCCTLIIVKNSVTHIYRGFCNHCNLFSIVTYTNCYEVITHFSLLFLFVCFKRTPTLFLVFQENLQIIFFQHAVSVKWNNFLCKIPLPLLSWTSPGLCGMYGGHGKVLCYTSQWTGGTGHIQAVQ